MIYWACVVIVLHAIFAVKADSHDLHFNQQGSTSQYAPGLPVGNRTTQLECCEAIVRNYYTRRFDPGNRYLCTFLESLRTWNCPQFQQECERQTFNYTDFTSLMYLRFCNRSQMEAQCYDDILSIVTKHNNEIQTTPSNFSQLILKLNLVTLTEEDLMNPCVQVAMYDSDSASQGHYHEIIEPLVPFYSYVWCGFDERVITKWQMSPWTCMPSRCRLILILYFVIKSSLGLGIVIGNATILGVLSFKKNDAQSVYRQSLAVADFIVGIAVLPMSIKVWYRLLIQSSTFTELRNGTGCAIANDSSLPMQLDIAELKYLLPVQFSNSYVSAFNFSILLSFSVSLTSLIVASFDRFVAISCPLKYDKLKAFFLAKLAVASLWVVALIFSFILTIVSSTGPSLNFMGLVSFGTKQMRLMNAILLLVAVVVLCCSIVATFVAARHNLRSSLRRHCTQRQSDIEMRLLVTLGVMMTVFTLCIAPKAITLMISVYVPYLDWRNPTHFDVVAATHFRSVGSLLDMLVASNSLWNCYIYSIREKTFRKAAKLLYKRIAQGLKLDQAWNLVSRRT